MTRQHPARILVALFVVGAGTGALAGCGDDEPSTEEATADVCDARENLDDTLTELDRLDPTDRSELDEARDEITDDVEELRSAGQELAESQWDNFEQAWESLGDTINDLDQDTTFREAREQLTSASEEITNAWDEFASNVDC
jgi:chromosome segregation ATPase